MMSVTGLQAHVLLMFNQKKRVCPLDVGWSESVLDSLLRPMLQKGGVFKSEGEYTLGDVGRLRDLEE